MKIGPHVMDSTDFFQSLFGGQIIKWDVYSSVAEFLLGFLPLLLIIHFYRHSIAKGKQDIDQTIFNLKLCESLTERIALESKCQKLTPQDIPEEITFNHIPEETTPEHIPKEVTPEHIPGKMTLEHEPGKMTSDREPEKMTPEEPGEIAPGHGPREKTLKHTSENITPVHEPNEWTCVQNEENHEVMIVDENEEDAGEAELKDWDTACTKNPGHPGFYSVEQFCINRSCLPTCLQHPVVLEYIQSIVGLTVSVEILKPGQESKVERRGTAFVCGTGEFEISPPANNGIGSRLRQMKLWIARTAVRRQLKLRTARHVVLNNDVSQRTVCRLKYHKWSDKQKCSILRGYKIESTDEEDDSCIMVCLANKRIACKLGRLLKKYKQTREKLVKMLNDATNDIPVHAVCVSHPHGLAKHITVGKYLGDVESRPYNWTYDTPTCPGSSGAPVCLIGKENGYLYGGNINMHSRVDNKFNRNASGEGWRSY